MRIAYAIVIFLSAGLIGLTAMAQGSQEETNIPEIEFKRDVFFVKTDLDSHYFNVEMALTPGQRARGLMYRRVLAEDAGMVFVFGDESPRSFWMRNTYVPLDIIYVNGRGEIVSIAKNTNPLDDTPVPSFFPAKFVLEVNAGTSDKLGIMEGHLLCHPTIPSNPGCYE